MIGNNLLLGSGDEGYNLTRSLRTRASASAYLSRTPASAGNQKTWTYSDWIKRGALGTDQVILSAGQGAGTLYFYLRFLASNALDIFTYDSNTATFIWQLTTTQVFRDPSAWYHLVISTDTTQATAANRVKIYVNGTQVTAFTTASYPSLNYDTRFNANIAHYISSYIGSANFADCYQTEINSVDGQALTPSSFGSTNVLTGVWQPARYTGTYGTNGFYLPFTDNSALTTSSNVGLGRDYSGNGNYWTTNNISITAGVTYDSMTDVPTLTSATAANFAVLNPLKSYYAPTNGNLSMSTGSSVTGLDVASIGLGTGVKYYFEATATGTNQQIGIFSSNHALTPTGSKRYWYLESGGLYNDGTLLQSVATFTSGDTIAVAWDGTAQTVTFYKNNTQQGTAISVDTSYSYFFGVGAFNGGWNVNFGQRPFTYTPPTGFVALNTFNLPTSTIVKGNTVMDATTWGGDGTSPRSITNSAGFKPDLVWVKNRSTSGYWNVLFDSVRGAGNQLSSNQTDAELASASNVAGKVSAFNTNGFDLQVGSSSIRSVNGSAENYVGWQWQAGQGSSSSNTNGTITSTVSVNASAGFSVVTYTGTGANATVGHGLGVAPSLVIVKQRNDSGTNWLSYHASLGATQGISLDSTSASNTSSTYWNNTAPTSSVFSIGTTTNVNRSTGTYVAYCWTPIAGYSAFGSYTGNSSTDGPFVYTGFRPKFVLVKDASNANNWQILDTARDTYNVAPDILQPNLSNAESAFGSGGIDFVSNGFKVRTSSTGINTSGATIIYAAFAENPFKNALAR